MKKKYLTYIEYEGYETRTNEDGDLEICVDGEWMPEEDFIEWMDESEYWENWARDIENQHQEGA